MEIELVSIIKEIKEMEPKMIAKFKLNGHEDGSLNPWIDIRNKIVNIFLTFQVWKLGMLSLSGA